MTDRLAIVGARAKWWGTRCNEIRDLVHALVLAQPPATVIVSGASPGGGVDAWAREAARSLHREIVEHAPAVKPGMTSGAYARACMKRNTEIVADCTRLIGIVAPGCTGTWDTIRKAKTAGKLERIVTP